MASAVQSLFRMFKSSASSKSCQGEKAMNIPHIGWRYWLMTIPLLIIGLTGSAIGFVVAIGLTIFQAMHFAWRERSTTAFSVQVRIAYLALLLLGLWGPLNWIHAVQLIGTTIRVVSGYCLLARTVSLLPWNRFEPLSMDLLRHTYFSPRGPSCSSRKEEGSRIPMPFSVTSVTPKQGAWFDAVRRNLPVRGQLFCSLMK